DLAVGQPFEIREQYDSALLLREGLERGVHFAVHRPSRDRRLVRGGGGLDVAPRPPRPRPPRPAGPLPPFHLAPPPPPPPQGVERPVARDRQYARHQRAAARVVLIDPPPHLHEHVPHHPRRPGHLFQDAQRQTEHPGATHLAA